MNYSNFHLATAGAFTSQKFVLFATLKAIVRPGNKKHLALALHH